MSRKRGDFSVVLLVFLVLFVTSLSIFIFAKSSEKVRESISDSSISTKLKAQGGLLDYYIRDSAEKAFFSTYNRALSDSSFSKDGKDSDGRIVFSGLNANLDENLEKTFLEEFRENFMDYDFDSEPFITLKNYVLSNEFEVSVQNENFLLDIPSVELKDSVEGLEIIYNKKISRAFEAGDFGMENFQSIYGAKEKCKTLQEIIAIENCFSQELKSFNVKAEEFEDDSGKEFFSINLESKNSIYFNGEKETISGDFVLA